MTRCAPGRLGSRPLLCLAGALLAACGGSGTTLDAHRLELPAAAAAAMAATRVDTSPDGGIYRNPDRLEVTLLASLDPRPITERLGTDASEWTPLAGLGTFTLIGVRLRNDGKASSEPALSDLQVASDFAPAGTAAGPLRRFYHPTYPLAALSPEPVTGDCTVHLDPGQTATVLLLYPPLQRVPELLWGRYHEFALRLRPGGGAGDAVNHELHVRTCRPPAAAGG